MLICTKIDNMASLVVAIPLRKTNLGPPLNFKFSHPTSSP